MADRISWHTYSCEQTLQALETTESGLSSEEAALRLEQYGANVIPEPAPKKLSAVYIDQFKNAFIYLLLLAALISLAVGELGDAIFIAVALQINAIIGTIQEWQAQAKALGLKNLVKSTIAVLHDNSWEQIDSHNLVPGDIVEIEAGITVPAALRLLSSEGLEADESLLTGESLPIVKDATAVHDSHSSLADRSNMLHAGTTVLRGHGIAIVAATGLSTEVGQVAESLKLRQLIQPPLIKRMEKFTHIVAAIMVVTITVIAFAEFIRGTEPISILMTSVALAVAAIPEGLPVALTVALAISVARMSKKDVVVRKMAAVEGLGACTMIAADKTGTLTVNELSIVRVSLLGGEEIPVKELVDQIKTSDQQNATFERLVKAGQLCNEARYEEQADGSMKLFGDTVDGAFLKLAHRTGLGYQINDEDSQRIGRIPYEPALAFAASFHALPESNRQQVWVKGAAEVILPFCQHDDHSAILQQGNSLARQGFRVIALAGGVVDGIEQDDLVNLEFIGLVALIDPLRPTARETIRACRNAGVSVRMITGDHPLTALEIGKQLDMAKREEDVITGGRLTELENDRTAFDAIVAHTRIFARIAPLQKLAIVQSMQRAGHTVAVTGDGVNDVSAIAAADIGAAMGRSGTDIARNAADLILIDDELSSLVDGIQEGRVAYDNIRKVIYLLISTGAAEIVLFMAAIATGLPLPLSPVQLLWLNLVTQGIQDVALAFEKGEPQVINRRPRPPQEGIFNRQMIEQTLLSGLLVGGVAFFHFQYFLSIGMSQFAASNQLLLLLVLFENAHVFNCRSEYRSVFSIPFRNNPFLIGGVLLVQLIHISAMNIPGISTVLDIEPLSLQIWFWSLLPALSIILVMELYKLVLRGRNAMTIT